MSWAPRSSFAPPPQLEGGAGALAGLSRRPWVEGGLQRRASSSMHRTKARAASDTGASGAPPLPPPSPPLRAVPRPADYVARVAVQFDRRAPRYDEGNTFHPPLAARLLELAALSPGEAVLDVGAGTGLVALPAAAAVGPQGHVTAVDLSTPMLDVAARKAAEAQLANLTLCAADIDVVDFPPASLNAILCSSALPLLPDIPSALRRWRRWLTPDGRLAFNAPKGAGSQAFTVFSEVLASQGLGLADPSALFAEGGEVRRMLASAGYSRVSLEVSTERNVRAGQTPEGWAAASWELCINFPLADLRAQLAPAELEALRRDYLPAAESVARRFATPKGIEEPYLMLWVLAQP